MRQIVTLFDTRHYPFEPLRSVVVDGGKKRSYIFFEKGSGLTIKEIRKNMVTFVKEFDEPCCVNDLKNHLKSFGMDLHLRYDVWDKITPKLDPLKFRNILDKVAESFKSGEKWERLRAHASVVYQHLENRGIRHSFKVVHPHYSMDTVTGRSKTSGYNIQGTTDKDIILPIEDGDLYFIHFDWTSADIRFASFMSQDPNMEKSFRESDPYTYVTDFLHHKEMTRDIIKKRFLSSFYSLQFDDPIFDIFPTFRKYMTLRLKFMEKNGYVESILGRKFKYTGDNKLSAFNSPFQGGVAHAMQASLVEIYKKFPMNLFTEVHDSIILVSDKKMISTLIKQVSNIMLCPLRPYLSEAPVMPLKVSVGNKWRSWKFLRVYKDEQK